MKCLKLIFLYSVESQGQIPLFTSAIQRSCTCNPVEY